MDLAFKTQNFTSSDQSFIVDPDYAGKVGCTIDLSKFASAQLTGFTAAGDTKGVIPAGIALGLVTASGKVGPYDDAAADGRQTLAGILWDDIPFTAGATTGNLGAARIVFGMVYEAKLPLAAAAAGTAGKIDTAAKADTAVKIAFV